MRPGYHAGGLMLHDAETAIEELASLGFAVVWLTAHRGTLHPDSNDPHANDNEQAFVDRLQRLIDVATSRDVRLGFDIDGGFCQSPHHHRGASMVSVDDAVSAAGRRWFDRWHTALSRCDGPTTMTFCPGTLEYDDDVDSGLPRGSAVDRMDHLSMRMGQWWSAVSPCEHVSIALRMRRQTVVAGMADACALIHHAASRSEPRDDSSRRDWTDAVGISASVGVMAAAGEFPLGDRLVEQLPRLMSVELCESYGGRDIVPGEGEIAMPRIIRTLARSNYTGPVVYRVDGHPERGLEPARIAIAQYEAAL